jgi:hypothetical protein
MRRSSSARSITARSDFFDFSSANGGDVTDDARSIGGSSAATAEAAEDPERAKERDEADQHMHRYVSEQLERYQDENYEEGDEFEAKA